MFISIVKKKWFLIFSVILFSFQLPSVNPEITHWESSFLKVDKNGIIHYTADENGNTIPDFSRVGYYGGDKEIPDVTVVKTVAPSGTDNDEIIIQSAIDEVAKRQLDKNGFRGAILLKKGTYKIPESIKITASGIVLRGEGDETGGTKLVATAKKQVSLITVAGKGSINEEKGSRVKVTDTYVPAGTFSFTVADVNKFKTGNEIILFRPGTQQWIDDLKMNVIEEREGTKQWQPKEYDLSFERIITKIVGNKIWIDNPVVMPMETKYGGAEIYKYSFEGRISHIGIEDIYFESEFEKDTAENHGWNAVAFNKIEHSWVRNVTAKYFGNSCVTLGGDAKNISVLNSNCFDHKSVITGSRRYSCNNNGQLNLFMNCKTTDGRHDYVTGADI